MLSEKPASFSGKLNAQSRDQVVKKIRSMMDRILPMVIKRHLISRLNEKRIFPTSKRNAGSNWPRFLLRKP